MAKEVELPVVEIEAISYAPVGAKRDEIWDECVVGEDLQGPVQGRFTSYILRCYRGDSGTFGAVQFKTDDGKRLKKQLTKIKGLKLDKENLDRRDVTKEIAAALSGKMAAIGGGLPGAIFVVQAKVDGKGYLAVLKLDLKKQEIVALRGTKGHRELFSEVFERAIPEAAKNFRKGVIFPSPVGMEGAEAWSVQYDHPADYWQHFVGVQPTKARKRIKKVILETVKQALKEETKDFTEAMLIKLEAKISELPERTPATIATAIKQATGMAKKAATLEERLIEGAGRTEFDDIAPVGMSKYEFRDGLKFEVPFRMLREKSVTVEQVERDVVIRIKHSPIERKDLPEDG